MDLLLNIYVNGGVIGYITKQTIILWMMDIT